MNVFVLPFRKILFAVDYSEPCQAIIPSVKEMVEHFSAELMLVHAYGAEALAYSPLPLMDPQLPEEVRKAAEDHLRKFAQTHFGRAELFTGVGEPASVIHDVVRHQGADLVMLGTHGRGAMRRFLLGSVTSKVLHDLTVPVWTSAPGAKLGTPYRSILAAVELTDEAETVVRAAAALAASYKAELRIASVLEMPPVSLETAFGPYKSDLVQAAEDIMASLKQKTGVDAPLAILDGPIADAIHDEAVRAKADLIVTGRGRVQGALSRMWSFLYPIIRQSPCPVLSI
jgi:universal stress protein A